jgi:hypothetical protein
MLLDLTTDDRDLTPLHDHGAHVQPVGKPLEDLESGEPLHIVGDRDGARIAGATPSELVTLLESLGLPKDVRQIDLIVDDSGSGGRESYAARFSAALEAEGFFVSEVKAPRGRVRWDAEGTMHVFANEQWQPATPELHTYVGPDVPEKHRGL